MRNITWERVSPNDLKVAWNDEVAICYLVVRDIDKFLTSDVCQQNSELKLPQNFFVRILNYSLQAIGKLRNRLPVSVTSFWKFCPCFFESAFRQLTIVKSANTTTAPLLQVIQSTYIRPHIFTTLFSRKRIVSKVWKKFSLLNPIYLNYHLWRCHFGFRNYRK